MVASPTAASPVAQLALYHPSSPTLSLELITHSNEVIRTQGKDRVVHGALWDEMNVTVSKAHNAISIEDLKPLAIRTSQELMSSHI